MDHGHRGEAKQRFLESSLFVHAVKSRGLIEFRKGIRGLAGLILENGLSKVPVCAFHIGRILGFTIHQRFHAGIFWALSELQLLDLARPRFWERNRPLTTSFWA